MALRRDGASDPSASVSGASCELCATGSSAVLSSGASRRSSTTRVAHHAAAAAWQTLLLPGREHRRALEVDDLGRRRISSAMRTRLTGQLGAPRLEVQAAGAQAVGLLAHCAQPRVLGAAVAASGHRERVGPARLVLAQRGGGLLELGAKLIHPVMVIDAPA